MSLAKAKLPCALAALTVISFFLKERVALRAKEARVFRGVAAEGIVEGHDIFDDFRHSGGVVFRLDLGRPRRPDWKLFLVVPEWLLKQVGLPIGQEFLKNV